METKKFTVVGFNEDNGQIVCLHVQASDGDHAFWLAAKINSTLSAVVALPGHLSEVTGELTFPGESVVDAETITTQPEVYCTALAQYRYVVGDWEHIFSNTKGASDIRFAFDTIENKIIAMQIRLGAGYEDATSVAVAEVQDSLLNANEEVLSNPVGNGFNFTNDLPNWATGSES